MTNKEKIKKIIEKDFDKSNNYNNIILRKEETKQNIKTLKYALISLFLIAIILTVNTKNSFKDKNEEQNNIIDTDNIKDVININEFALISAIKDEITKDIDGKAEDLEIQEIYKLFPQLENIYIPKYLANVRNIKLFSKNDLENDYTLLDGYNIMYTDNNKSLEIFISNTLKEKRRCIAINYNNILYSTINNYNLSIINFNETFIINFKYKDLYYDIETKYITKDEILKIIKSILV